MAIKFRTSQLSPRDQGALVRTVYSGFHYKVKQGYLVCTGRIQPTPLNQSYLVRIECRPARVPQAWLLDPVLEARSPGENIPHTYGNERPCFFDPKTDWRPDLKIALTIIPWLSLWLFYYEVWRATGTWYGGGTHPTEYDAEADE